MMRLLAVLVLAGLAYAKQGHVERRPSEPSSPDPLNATLHGYLPVDGVSVEDGGAALFYVYFESQGGTEEDTPVVLWLQGGPGCSSLFGALYELGPSLVDAHLCLRPNSGAWNRRAGLLFIDQPAGVGFSRLGKRHAIPTDEMMMAADLYVALQVFFERHASLAARPLVIAGESYAGKYVPSIGHFILQMQNASKVHSSSDPGGAPSSPRPPHRRRQLSNPRGVAPSHHRALPEQALGAARRRSLLLQPPRFDLRGLVIGNGLTDPGRQVMTHADVAAALGLLDRGQRVQAMATQLEIVRLITAEKWGLAHALRSDLLSYIKWAGGVATMLDVRRWEEYDAGKTVDAYLNHPDVKAELGVPPGQQYHSCSEEVGQALGPDVMKSVAYLIPDLLAAYPLLLYQGQYDAQDGPASTEAWVNEVQWPGRRAFLHAKRSIVRARQVEDSGTQRRGSSGGGEAASWQAQQQGSAAWRTGWRCCELLEDEGAGSQATVERPTGQQRQGGVAAAAARRRTLRGATDAARPSEPTAAAQQSPAARLSGHGGHAGRTVAYWKQLKGLTHVVVRDAGHMVPTDQPEVGQWMVERWLEQALPSAGGGEA